MQSTTYQKPLSAYEAWVLLMSIRVHFKNSKPLKGLLWNRFPESKFVVHPERFFANQLANKLTFNDRIATFVASNFVLDPDMYFHSVSMDDCLGRYREARRVISAPTHFLKANLLNFTTEELLSGQAVPKVFDMMLRSEATPEEVILYDICNPFMNDISQKNVLTERIIDRLKKYKPFVSIKTSDVRDSIKTEIDKTNKTKRKGTENG